MSAQKCSREMDAEACFDHADRAAEAASPLASLYLPHPIGAILTLLFGLLLVHFGTRAFGRLLTRSPHTDVGNDRSDGVIIGAGRDLDRFSYCHLRKPGVTVQ
jgi:hypothetical protein